MIHLVDLLRARLAVVSSREVFEAAVVSEHLASRRHAQLVHTRLERQGEVRLLRTGGDARLLDVLPQLDELLHPREGNVDVVADLNGTCEGSGRG